MSELLHHVNEVYTWQAGFEAKTSSNLRQLAVPTPSEVKTASWPLPLATELRSTSNFVRFCHCERG